MELGRIGVWWSGSWKVAAGAPDSAAPELEALGYTAFWSSGGFATGLASRFGRLLDDTRQVAVLSGIQSIWTTPPDVLAAAVSELETRHPGRFHLGLGVSHAVAVQDYGRPYGHMVDYLDALDAAGAPVAKERRVLAVLRPRMLTLAAERAAGAHPYFAPAEHTARACEVMGPGALVAPEVTVVLDADATEARRTARAFMAGYLDLPNYADNLRSLGYDDGDVVGGGSDRLVDAVVAWGDVDDIAEHVGRQVTAGADHVCIQVVAPHDVFPLDAYRRLAPALLGS